MSLRPRLVDPQLRASNDHYYAPSKLACFSLQKVACLISHCAQLSHPPTRWHAETCHYPMRGPSDFLHFALRGVAEAALYCAHRTSTVSSCAFCEQEGHLAAPFPSQAARCASTGDQQTTLSFFPNLHPPSKGRARGSSTARVERAPSERARPRARRTREPAPSYPLRRILIPRFFFCEPPIQSRQDQQREYR